MNLFFESAKLEFQISFYKANFYHSVLINNNGLNNIINLIFVMRIIYSIWR